LLPAIKSQPKEMLPMRRSRSWIIREVTGKYLEDVYDLESSREVLLNKDDKIISCEELKKRLKGSDK